MTSPTGGVRDHGRGPLAREVKMLRQAVRNNGERISKLEHRTVWFAGFLSASIFANVISLIRSFLPAGGS